MNPTQRSLEWLRDNGWLPGVVEKWNKFANVRQDLYGFVDILAVKPGEPTLAVQACRGADVSTRRAKILTHDPEKKACPHCNARIVLASGWRVVVHGWRQNAAGHWVLREEEVLLPGQCYCQPGDPPAVCPQHRGTLVLGEDPGGEEGM